ncbi:MAG TPA: tRNA pseudouridine(55) synthase TruB [Cyclobacteriaceae bacterium]|nr:tRNA pseudouridine(55) synthase TruB [Cyclobacteriaceae bacterium]
MVDSQSSDRVILVNKPLEWTSFDVVRKLRYKLKIKKIGHAGTLDPLATGLLILCTGKLTKKIDEYQAQEKEYTGRFIIGQSTPTHDLESEVNETFDISGVTEEKIRATAQKFVGNIEQVPPMHSAIKVNGKRAYELARKGDTAELKKRPITISEFEITGIALPSVSFRVVCTKGTYIRSLARDFGLALGGGAYLAELCRTRIGSFLLKDALEIEDIAGA